MTLDELFFGALAGGMIVVAGGFYAFFFALGQLRSSRRLNYWALVSYGVLAGSTYVLVQSLRLSGFWIFVTAVMLLGYFFAPRAIWKLSVGTHEKAQTGMLNSNSPDVGTTQ